MTQEYRVGDKVVMAWRVGVIVKKSRLGRVDGYDVQSLVLEPGDGTLPHFYEAYYLKPAIVGETICRMPKGQHWCGLIHVPDPERYPISPIREA